MDGSAREVVARIVGDGYEGLEAVAWAWEDGEWGSLVGDSGLRVVGQIIVEDVEAAARQLDQVAGRCERVNAHTGKDWWDEERGARLMEDVMALAGERGLPVSFETHRGRSLYHPVVTERFLGLLPGLRLTADYSHFACVCESHLEDQAARLAGFAGRVDYVHARVGHPEGPQVGDPRAARWSGSLDAHLGWWDWIRSSIQSRGEGEMLVNPEFGPPDYQWTEPETGRVLAEVEEVSRWTRDLLRGRWGA